jgi:hypothetical protein
MGKCWVFASCLFAGFGCSNTTETGYTPRVLGDSETVHFAGLEF